jgi:hypothetical protein
MNPSGTKEDFGWLLCRLSVKETLSEESQEPQTVPSWSGFNALIRKQNVPSLSTIGYYQVIDVSPTELPTVYTLLKRSLDMADQLE